MTPQLGRLLAYIGMVVLVIVTALFSAQFAANREHKQTENIFTLVCDANNVSKAASIISEEQRLSLMRLIASDNGEAIESAKKGVAYVRALNPILNCDETFEGDGRAVFLPPNVHIEYLRLVGAGYVPELDGARIVGKHRPETGEQADF